MSLSFSNLVTPSFKSEISPEKECASHKRIYESEMRPLLEEYWLKLNAMLGYVQNDDVRYGYECRAVYQINKHGIIEPMSYAGYDTDKSGELYKFWFAENLARGLLGQAESAMREQRAVQTEITRQQAIINRETKAKDSWSDNFTIRIPIGIDVWVSFGLDSGNLKAGYGAYGHEIIHKWNSTTGTREQTIITRTSVLPTGLGELGSLVDDLGNVLHAGNGLEVLMGKINPIQNIPSFDRTRGEGKTYTFDRNGQQIDVATIKETSTSVSWGGLGMGQTSTTARQGFMSNSNAEKIDITFGPLTIHR